MGPFVFVDSEGWLMNTDYERVQQEAVSIAAYLKALSRYLPGGTEKSHTKKS
jgi:hypothetical protein